MAEVPSSVKVGVWQFSGPEPGYEWTVLILSSAFDDGERLLNEDQREYVAMQVKDLAGHVNPGMSETQSIDMIESFLEIRLKGGGVGPRVNVRIYYDYKEIDERRKFIRILGVDKKENEGQISVLVKNRILRRQKNWDAGKYPMYEFSAPLHENEGR